MRKVSILSLWLAAFLMAVCFIGCSNGNTSDDSGEESATENSTSSDNTTSSTSAITFKGTLSSINYTFVFSADGKFKVTSAVNAYAVEDDYTGTYTGDASQDGTVVITILKHRVYRDLVDYTGSDATQELTIANSKFTFDGTEFTRH